MDKIILQGVPYDKKSSYLAGPALAPPLIRETYHSPSANYYAENGYNITPEVFEDKGDFEIQEYFDIENITRSNLIKGTPLLSLGGDHSITYPIVKAIQAVYGTIDILHIDAHGDLYSHFEGDPYSHACPFHNIMKDGLAQRLVQIGIRTLTAEQRENAQKYEVEIIGMRDIDDFTMPVFERPLYLSVDLDALDPAFAPGVSHYEPGGLTVRQLIQLIQDINVPLVAADIVEYNPTRDINGMTAMVCAKIVREITAKMMQTP
ncbi:MAG: agmatinase [Flavobacteriaceae bacterium]